VALAAVLCSLAALALPSITSPWGLASLPSLLLSLHQG